MQDIEINNDMVADRCGAEALAYEEERRRDEIQEEGFYYHAFKPHTIELVFPKIDEICEIMRFPPLQRAELKVSAATHDGAFNSSDPFAYRHNEYGGAALAISWMRRSPYRFASNSEVTVATNILWTNPTLICLGLEPPTDGAKALQLADLAYIAHSKQDVFFDQERAFREEVKGQPASGLYGLANGPDREWAIASLWFMRDGHRFWFPAVEEAWGDHKKRNLRAYQEIHDLS